MTATLVILLLAVTAFISNKIAPPIVALAVALALYATGTVTLAESLAGFSDPVVLYLAALYVVSESLDATGVTAWAGQQLVHRVGGSLTAVTAALMLVCAALTALISVNGAVAALVPVAVMVATRTGEPPSQILMPLAFAAHAGSLLTLLGTPVNVLVSELSVEAGSRPFGFFEFAFLGLPLLGGTILTSLLMGKRLLPSRQPMNARPDLSFHAETLAAHYAVDDDRTSISHNRGVSEVMIAPRSPFEGSPVFPGMRTQSGDLVVVAVHRAGEDIGSARLQAGDVVVLRGTWDALDRQAGHPGLLPVNPPSELRRHAVRLGARSYTALTVLAAMCTMLALDIAPAAIVSLTAAGTLVALRVLSVPQAQHAISLPTLLIVAGMVPMSTAIQSSGLADSIADGLLRAFGDRSPLLLQLTIVLTVVVMGQFISNLATVLIVAPIAMTAAATADLSPLPLLMGITVAGAASFITPVATAANLMVQEPGGYRFGDYWRPGLPNLALFVLAGSFLAPLIWPY
ncbi:SLC13 family permease [Streptomyces sp. NPDC057682]|uniref:SLC13 family permease n=1 Tax=Streptomyces sp. NPDC057682 TaxID=3346210 RepID=UPI003686ABA4